jgi:hypothetical protein
MRNRKSNRPEGTHFIHVSKCTKVSVFYAIMVLWAKWPYRTMGNVKLVML